MILPKVLVMRMAGTNCETETAYAFNKIGADSEIVHINSIKKGFRPEDRREFSMDDYHILAIPGGFSGGDYIKAGKMYAEDIRGSLKEVVEKFVKDGKPIIGICNGFQVLAQLGLVPNGKIGNQTISLTYNESKKFEARWVNLTSPENNCIWTKNMNGLYLPVANAEGNVRADKEEVQRLFDDNLVVFQYADAQGNPTQSYPENPSGSIDAIAAITDPTGRILGIMPHPERYNHPMNHNLATLQKIASMPYIDRDDPAVQRRLKLAGTLPAEGMGLQILRNGVDYVIENLLR
ncbi:phosphoribosylformylglycinamidine synthase I [archaeon]|nr:phosphoribosylformylglycinamidine synthase I [archaeon]